MTNDSYLGTDLPDNVRSALTRSDEVFRDATENHEFEKVFAAVSGGNDSGTALEVAFRSDEIDLDGVVFIDTGINVFQTKEFVKQEAEKRGLEFHCIDEEYVEPYRSYENLVLVYGFPGPPQHSYMYANLKGERLNGFLDSFDGKIGLISGVMKDESDRRKMNIGDDAIEEDGSSVWISPLYDWYESTVDTYREHLELRENDVTALLHVSGDCNCGAYGHRDELRELLNFYPNAAKKIEQLERKVVKRAEQGKIPAEFALWAHGRDNLLDIDLDDNTRQTNIMCSGCENRVEETYEHSNEPLTVAEGYLRSDEHSLTETLAVYCVDCDIVVQDGREHRETVHPDAGASPNDLDIRAIPSRCSDIGNIRWTEGEISTKHPDGEFCDGITEYHDWVKYNGPNNVAERKCTNCGAFEVPASPEGITADIWPYTAGETPHNPTALKANHLRGEHQTELNSFADSPNPS